MLVGGLGKADLGRLLGDSLMVRHKVVAFCDWALSIIFFKILEAGLEMELATAGNSVSTRLFTIASDERI